MAVLDQQVGLHRKGRAGGVGTEEPGRHEGPQVARRREPLEDGHEDQAEGKAAGEVGPEGGPWEAVRGDVDEPGDTVAGRGAESPTHGDGKEHRRRGTARPPPGRAAGGMAWAVLRRKAPIYRQLTVAGPGRVHPGTLLPARLRAG